jgi:hypothetical protein
MDTRSQAPPGNALQESLRLSPMLLIPRLRLGMSIQRFLLAGLFHPRNLYILAYFANIGTVSLPVFPRLGQSPRVHLVASA